MAFILKNLENLSGSGAGFKLFTYPTADSLATVLAAGYFNDVSTLLNVGDCIMVSVGDALPVNLVVQSITSAGVVTVGAGLTAGAGITAGTGTVYRSGISGNGVITTQILIDLTGLSSVATDGDIIGVSGSTDPAHIGQILDACGTILGGVMRCLEVPAGGDPNIALYAATEGTGLENGAIGDLTENIVFDPNADWTIDMDRSITTPPTADQYLYLVQGDATGTAAAYTAGKFLIELYGY